MTRTSTDLLLLAPPERWLQYCPALLSALLAIVLYGVTLGGGYVFDDHFIVHDDPRLHQPRQWVAFWTHDYFDGGIDNLYRPLVSSSYAVQWWLHGDKPALFHAVNLVLHALVSASIAEFTRRVLIWKPGHRVIATCAGLLFAAHPIHVEAVANLVGRAELACTLCIIAVLVLLSRGPPAMPKLIGVMTVAIAGMLCKEQAIIQPLLWLFLGIFIWEKFASGTERRSRATRLVLMTSWIWAIYLIAREHLLKFEWDRSNLDPTIQPLVLSAGLDRILMPIVLLGHYTALLVWPAHLSVDYGADALGHVAHASDLYLWVGLTAVVCWVGLAMYCLRRRTPVDRIFLFCLLSLGVCYGVVGNVIALTGTIFAERLMYLPSAFFLILAAIFIAKLPKRWGLFVMTLWVTLASVRTLVAARTWNHPLELYRASIAAQPRSIQAHLLLAEEYHRQREFQNAAKTLADVCGLYPNYWRVWKARADEAIEDGQLEEASQYLARAVALNHHPSLVETAASLEKARTARRTLVPSPIRNQ